MRKFGFREQINSGLRKKYESLKLFSYSVLGFKFKIGCVQSGMAIDSTTYFICNYYLSLITQPSPPLTLNKSE